MRSARRRWRAAASRRRRTAATSRHRARKEAKGDGAAEALFASGLKLLPCRRRRERELGQLLRLHQHADQRLLFQAVAGVDTEFARQPAQLLQRARPEPCPRLAPRAQVALAITVKAPDHYRDRLPVRRILSRCGGMVPGCCGGVVPGGARRRRFLGHRRLSVARRCYSPPAAAAEILLARRMRYHCQRPECELRVARPRDGAGIWPLPSLPSQQLTVLVLI